MCGFLILTFIGFSALSYAQEGIRFVVKPRLCVLADDEEICQDKLVVRWDSDQMKSVCLFQNNKTLPLRCWEHEKEGKHDIRIKTGEDIEFQLREIKDKSLVIAQLFEVVQDNQKYRRKRRNPWSFF